MGTDISMMVEKNIGNVWVSMDKWTKYPYDDEDEDFYHIEYEDQFYKTRNYDLFSILANVRNGYGFAGHYTGRGFKFIAEPRGFPDDCSEYVRKVYERQDGHSYSWFTLREILDFDWTQKTIKSGLLTPEEWASVYSGNKPESWIGNIQGPGVSIHDSSEFVDAWEKLKVKYQMGDVSPISRLGKYAENKDKFKREFISYVTNNEYPYARVEWEVHYYEQCKEFLSESVPKLLKMAEGDYDSVRIIFYFDC